MIRLERPAVVGLRVEQEVDLDLNPRLERHSTAG
jgi:hypothetical protein